MHHVQSPCRRVPSAGRYDVAHQQLLRRVQHVNHGPPQVLGVHDSTQHRRRQVLHGDTERTQVSGRPPGAIHDALHLLRLDRGGRHGSLTLGVLTAALASHGFDRHPPGSHRNLLGAHACHCEAHQRSLRIHTAVL